MGAKESNIFKECQIRASKLGSRLWRQNSGLSWAGRVQRIENTDDYRLEAGCIVIHRPQAIRAGFPGISDGGGYCMMTVTPEMVGRSLPVVLQVETKADGSVTDEQRKFIAHIRKVGGRAGIARHQDDVDGIIAGVICD